MKKFLQRLMIIFFPIGMLYAIGKALFYRGDFIVFIGCLSLALITFIVGAVASYNNPQVIESIEQFFNNIKAVFAKG